MGWHVIQIWECQLKPKVREEYLEGLLLTLNRILIMNYQPMIYKTEDESVGMVAEPV